MHFVIRRPITICGSTLTFKFRKPHTSGFAGAPPNLLVGQSGHCTYIRGERSRKPPRRAAGSWCTWPWPPSLAPFLHNSFSHAANVELFAAAAVVMVGHLRLTHFSHEWHVFFTKLWSNLGSRWGNPNFFLSSNGLDDLSVILRLICGWLLATVICEVIEKWFVNLISCIIIKIFILCWSFKQ